MSQLLIVTGRPFAGKKVFAQRIAKQYSDAFELVKPKKNSEKQKLSVIDYFSKTLNSDVSILHTELMKVLGSDKIAIVYCNNNDVKSLVDFAKDWGFTSRTVFVDCDFNISLKRYLESQHMGLVPSSKAESLTVEILDFINNEKSNQHQSSFDLFIKAKQIEKAGLKKVLKLFNPNSKFESAEFSKRDISFVETSHTVGTKALIYNQLKAYGVINSVTLNPLVNAISACAELYRSRTEEAL